MMSQKKSSSADPISEYRGPLRNIDTALLRTFATVIDAGSLEKAGDRVFRTQAAVSQQLKRLESLVDDQLFKKDGRKLVLTNVGERLLAYSRRVLNLHDEMLFAIASDVDPSCSKDLSINDNFSVVGLKPEDKQVVAVRSGTNGSGQLEAVQVFKRFEDNLRADSQRLALKVWREKGAKQGSLTLEQLVEAGVNIGMNDGNGAGLVFSIDEKEIRIIDATPGEIIDYGLEKSGLGAAIDQLAPNQAIVEQRRAMYLACYHGGVPLFYAGNATLPPNSKIYLDNPGYLALSLERLVLPVRLPRKGNDGDGAGIIIVGAWNPNKSYAILDEQAHSKPLDAKMTVTEQVVFGF